MNKYSSLKLLTSLDYSLEDPLQTYPDLRSLSPKLGISLFTMYENMSNSKTQFLNEKNSIKFPEISRSPLPSDKNFNDLIDKLDQITSNRRLFSKECILDEEEEFDLVIEEDAIFHVKIVAKGKKNPLKVTIKRYCGKILSYCSLTVPKPNYSNCDKTFHTDYYEIRTLQTSFQGDYVFLSLRAITNAKLTISVSFGIKHLTQFPLTKKEKNPKIIEVNEERIRQILEFRKSRYKKNYIIENFHKRMLSPDEIFNKNKNWLLKHDKAVEKKKHHLEEKKLKALRFLNKQQIRAENEKCEKEKQDKLGLQNEVIKGIIKVVLVMKSCQVLDSIRHYKRKSIFEKVITSQKVRKIQRYVKRYSLIDSKDFLIPLNRAQENLLLFHNIFFKIDKKETENKLFQSISLKVTAFKPSLRFTNLFDKVIRIQQYFRRYSDVKTERLRKLILFWDECKLFHKRRSMKKKTLIQELNVSISKREDALQGYYLACVKKFYEALREGVFISEVNEKPIRKYVRFEYMPNSVLMKQLIDSVSLSKKSSFKQTQ